MTSLLLRVQMKGSSWGSRCVKHWHHLASPWEQLEKGLGEVEMMVE